MSKIGKKNINIPKDSSVKTENGTITITGPKGSKQLTINEKIFSAKVNENNEFNIMPLINKGIDKKTLGNTKLYPDSVCQHSGEKTLDNKFECPICYCVVEDPKKCTDCKRIFCGKCI